MLKITKHPVSVRFHQEERVTSLPNGYVFVFGSNTRGAHGKGAALDAVKLFGAQYGVGLGIAGKSFAIPTKDVSLRVLDTLTINQYIQTFKSFVEANPHLTFYLTPIGCGLAGYTAADIAPLFLPLRHLDIIFPISFQPYLITQGVSHV
jgi:hypothetical protein